MSLFEVGRLAMKIAGRDAGRKCVVVETIDNNFVTIDGDVRRKKVNIKHLEPLTETIDIKDKASHDEVKKAFEKLGLPVWDKKSKKPTERPKQIRKKNKSKVEEKPAKKEKKAEKKKAAEPVKEKAEPSIEKAVETETKKE
jgi:large subunit ribosomal protein L14e